MSDETLEAMCDNEIMQKLGWMSGVLADSGYGEQSGDVMRAMVFIHEQAQQIEKLREALKEAADYLHDAYLDIGREEYKAAEFAARAAAAALEGVTEPASPWRGIESAPNDQIILVYDKSASTKIVAAFLSEGGWLYAEGFEADPEGPIPTHWMPLPEPPR